MSYQTLIKALYTNFIGSASGGAISLHTYDTFPDDDDIGITANASANVEGSWGEIVSSVGSVDVWFTGLYVSDPNAATDYKVSFGTGAAASEIVRAVFPYTVGALVTTSQGQTDNFYTVPFPIHITSGTREAARAKTGSASADTINVVEHHAIGLV